jgi:RNA polymerase sigma-70 factor (ECF subfamily)
MSRGKRDPFNRAQEIVHPFLERLRAALRHVVSSGLSGPEHGREGALQRDLVEAARDGDHEAFEVLASAAGDRLYRFAWLVLGDSHQAEDAVQDAIVRAWQGLPELRDPERWEAWLHRLIVNACADQGRLRMRQSVEVRMVRLEPAARDDVHLVDDHDQLDRGFRKLKPGQRAAVVLHFYLGLSVPEVADALGVPVGTAKSRIHYAVDAMRAALEADERTPIATTGGLTQ